MNFTRPAFDALLTMVSGLALKCCEEKLTLLFIRVVMYSLSL